MCVAGPLLSYHVYQEPGLQHFWRSEEHSVHTWFCRFSAPALSGRASLQAPLGTPAPGGEACSGVYCSGPRSTALPASADGSRDPNAFALASWLRDTEGRLRAFKGFTPEWTVESTFTSRPLAFGWSGVGWKGRFHLYKRINKGKRL